MFHMKQFIGFYLFINMLSITSFSGCSGFQFFPHSDMRADIESEYFKFRKIAIDNQDKIAPDLWEILIEQDKEIIAKIESLRKNEAIYLISDILPLILGVYGIIDKNDDAKQLSILIREATK